MADDAHMNAQPTTTGTKDSKRSKRRRYQRRMKLKTIAALTFLSLLLLFALLANRILFTINSGQSGVRWRRFHDGTVLDKTYEEGFFIIPPWDKFYIYNIRNQQVSADVQALSVNGLSIDVSYSVRYRPEKKLLPLLHTSVGPDYLNVVITPEVEATIRKVIGQYYPEEIYSSQRAIVERMVSEAFLQIEERFIVVDDLLITRITLPEKVRNAIEDKLAEKEIAESFIYRIKQAEREAKRKEIESKGIAVYNQTVNTSLNPDVLRWQGIMATKDLATSQNAKVVVIGSDEKGLPIILGNQ